MTLTEFINPLAERLAADLKRWLVEPAVPPELADGMRYCLDGGKRLRPSLVYLSARAVGGDDGEELVRRAAVSVELVHAYSLVHDDLPAMDNDDRRRGKATAHVKYSPAMAILIGDALLTRAMGLLAEHGGKTPPVLIAELAAGVGASGMVAGQVADLGLCAIPGGLEGIEYIHVKKTAALMQTAARMGAIAAGTDSTTTDAVGAFGKQIGLAFQIFDDLLDSGEDNRDNNSGDDVNRPPGSCLLFLASEEARRLGEERTAEALACLSPLGAAAEPLRVLAKLLVSRTN